MVRMREREEQEVTDLYTPPTSPLSCPCKSKLHLLTDFMIWHSRKDEWKLPQVLFEGKQARSTTLIWNCKWKKGQFALQQLQDPVSAGLLCRSSKIQSSLHHSKLDAGYAAKPLTHLWGWRWSGGGTCSHAHHKWIPCELSGFDVT